LFLERQTGLSRDDLFFLFCRSMFRSWMTAFYAKMIRSSRSSTDASTWSGANSVTSMVILRR
jgi:hypothetical protein